MQITVKLLRTNDIKTVNIKNHATVIDLLRKLDIKPDTVIVTTKNQPIPIDEKLNENQEITIIQVSSGG